MEKNRQHHNSQFIRFFKNAFAVFGFAFPIYLVSVLLPRFITSPVFPIDSFLALILMLIISPICSLIAAYFFTDLEVDESGLLVEFLWKRLRVPWNKVLQIKPLFGIRTRKQGMYVVIADGLTPFHRLYGLIYGFSLKPAFILWPTINDFEVLKNDIEMHIKKNETQNF